MSCCYEVMTFLTDVSYGYLRVRATEVFGFHRTPMLTYLIVETDLSDLPQVTRRFSQRKKLEPFL